MLPIREQTASVDLHRGVSARVHKHGTAHPLPKRVCRRLFALSKKPEFREHPNRQPAMHEKLLPELALTQQNPDSADAGRQEHELLHSNCEK